MSWNETTQQIEWRGWPTELANLAYGLAWLAAGVCGMTLACYLAAVTTVWPGAVEELRACEARCGATVQRGR